MHLQKAMAEDAVLVQDGLLKSTVDRGALPPAPLTSIPPGLTSPGISIEFHGDSGTEEKPALIHPRSAPPDMQSFPSPMRHHKRTPSAHREIKETLNARSQYMEDEKEGRQQFRINQYLIKEEIGHGTFGSVHLAVDQFGTEYAVKEFSKARLRKRAQSNILRHNPRRAGRLPPRAGFGAPDFPNRELFDQKAKEEQDALYLIRHEVAIMKKLNHPNLVQLIEVLDDPLEDSLYMVMEMCKKGVVMRVDLGKTANPFPEEQCRHWFRDLILGIEYLHSQGVVHRDIKPDNLLLSEDDVLKIADFGVSEMFEKSTEMRTAKSAGSPAFLPPELCGPAHGEVSGKAADIWSMGVSLYCFRYGRLPFESESLIEIREAIRTQPVSLPADENPDFIDLMEKILEKDPDKRITMAELREHPWVTKGGTDPLLSTEENCSDPVEPNPLEVNRAFTQRMSHLICVLKAIRRFKKLLAQARARKASRTSFSSTASSSSPDSAQQTVEDTADIAAKVVRERQELIRQSTQTAGIPVTRPSVDLLLPLIHPPLSNAPTDSPYTAPLLGIGVGGHDEFSGDDPAAFNVVSDSPGVVDFNVYDLAFKQEMERIRRSGSRKGRAPWITGPGEGLRGRVSERVQEEAAEDGNGEKQTEGGQGGEVGEEREENKRKVCLMMDFGMA